VEAFVTAGAGFLLAVLWFDLMHDVQVRGHRSDAPLPEPVLASIAMYYARVTTGARPMNRLIALTMLATLVATVVELVNGFTPPWVAAVTLLLMLVAVGLAARRTVPAAVRLGTRLDDIAEQSRLAHRIYREHLVCLGCIASVVVLQLAVAAR
jgi:hypothetical protein